MRGYDHRSVEAKWQRFWAEHKVFSTPERPRPDRKQYILDMFPYPSGAGLHVGHPLGYIGTDILARYFRANGHDVLHPMGFDAFGLPAEGYAIKTGVHPAKTTEAAVARYREQLEIIGLSYDWDRLVVTSRPDYYRWTQWLFLQLYKQGLAYRANAAVNWCTQCQTVLANEQVVDGRCERCGTEVIQKQLEQWFFRITHYADELLSSIDALDWPESIRSMQRNWIGRSTGVLVRFPLIGHEECLEVFTTRIDTIFSAAFLVVAPEHPLLQRLPLPASHAQAVQEYITGSTKRSDLDRQSDTREKTGVFTGLYVRNPADGREIPVWVGDFVLGHYGTGAVFGDAHDQRDFTFAQKYGIPLTVSIVPEDETLRPDVLELRKVFTDDGILINSGQFDGLTSSEARSEIAAWLAEKGSGYTTTQYKLRDWLVSRQRYWGAPIPIVYCDEHGEQPVHESELPVILPLDVDFRPTGESPLVRSRAFHETARCPVCGKSARREVDTMDTFVDSSWYFLRYADPRNDQQAFLPERVKEWMPVDWYVGGAEHAVLHLLYARFFTKALADAHLLSFREPFLRLRNQGMIGGEDGRKMSKRWGNVINPDDVVRQYGADTLRAYEMFMGPFSDSKPWNTRSIIGVRRWLDKVYDLHEIIGESDHDSSTVTALLHDTIRKVTHDIEGFRFNTAVSALMILANAFRDERGVSRNAFAVYLRLLAPFAPHLAEELWEKLRYEGSVRADWPVAPERLADVVSTIVIQVNGRVRGTIDVSTSADQSEVERMAKSLPNIERYLLGEIVRVVYVPGRLLNLITTGIE